MDFPGESGRQALGGLRAAGTCRRRAALSARQLVAIGLAAGLLAVAGLIHTRTAAPDPAPSDQFVGFYCPACGQYFELSHREFERLWDRKDFRRAGDGPTLLFRCKHCGRLTAERADRRPVRTPSEGGK